MKYTNCGRNCKANSLSTAIDINVKAKSLIQTKQSNKYDVKKKKKAIILDLDNTVYSVSSIGNKLFSSLFKLIKDNGNYNGNLEEIKTEIQRKSFHFVAEKYSFEKTLIDDGISLLKELTYNEKMDAYPDYAALQKLKIHKYLVTSGFTKLQLSKVKQRDIGDDFQGDSYNR